MAREPTTKSQSTARRHTTLRSPYTTRSRTNALSADPRNPEYDSRMRSFYLNRVPWSPRRVICTSEAKEFFAEVQDKGYVQHCATFDEDILIYKVDAVESSSMRLPVVIISSKNAVNVSSMSPGERACLYTVSTKMYRLLDTDMFQLFVESPCKRYNGEPEIRYMGVCSVLDFGVQLSLRGWHDLPEKDKASVIRHTSLRFPLIDRSTIRDLYDCGMGQLSMFIFQSWQEKWDEGVSAWASLEPMHRRRRNNVA